MVGEKARVNLLLERRVWGDIKSEAFKQKKSASALINDSFKDRFKNGSKPRGDIIENEK